MKNRIAIPLLLLLFSVRSDGATPESVLPPARKLFERSTIMNERQFWIGTTRHLNVCGAISSLSIHLGTRWWLAGVTS